MNGFYRARCFEVKEDLLHAMEAPDIELGPPPSDIGAVGRMNSRSISVFYGSNSAEVALAEIRPPVGSYVLVGKFQLVRRVRLLNLRKQKTDHAVRSYYDPNFLDLPKKVIFIQKLTKILSQPALLGAEDSEYLPTQIISDYLANIIEPPFDGILFSSAQAASSRSQESDIMSNTNVVLFNRSSNVRSIGYKVKAWDISYEEVGNHLFAVDVENSELNVLREDEDPRTDTLEVDKESLRVHIVDGVVVKSKSHPVFWGGVSEAGNIEV